VLIDKGIISQDELRERFEQAREAASPPFSQYSFWVAGSARSLPSGMMRPERAVHHPRRRFGSLGSVVDDPVWLMLGLRRGGRASDT
jgi:hypothetical protein